MNDRGVPVRKTLLADAEAAQRQFSRAVRALQQAQVSYIERAPDLEPGLLETCRVVPNRAALLAQLPKGGAVAEVGAVDHERTAFIANLVQATSLQVFAVEAAADRLAESGLLATVHVGDPIELLARLPRDSFDLVCLNSDSPYESAQRALVAVEARLKPGGHLVVNDYAVWSVASMSRSGVARAVNEFANSRRWPVATIALQSAGYYDLCLLRPR